jgi:hypothetical protein
MGFCHGSNSDWIHASWKKEMLSWRINGRKYTDIQGTIIRNEVRKKYDTYILQIKFLT